MTVTVTTKTPISVRWKSKITSQLEEEGATNIEISENQITCSVLRGYDGILIIQSLSEYEIYFS